MMGLLDIFRKKNLEEAALDVISRHRGKEAVYKKYLRTDPEKAKKYLRYIANNTSVRYIKWDDDSERFTIHSSPNYTDD